MKERERHQDEIQTPLPVGAGGRPDGDLRERVERLLAEGSDVIERALSGNSAAFLEGNRQEGGQ